MAQPDDLDTALTDLAQAFADIGFVLSVVRDLRRNADRLRPALREELGILQAVITRVVGLL